MTKMEHEYKITFEPVGRKTVVSGNTSLLNAAQDAGIELAAFCGGKGTCCKCIINLVKGKLSAPTETEIACLSEETVNKGFRLACQAYPESDVRIYIPMNSMNTSQRLQLEGLSRGTELDQAVKGTLIKLSAPTMQDLISDELRIQAALKPAILNSSVLHDFSDILREENWSVKTVIREKEIIGILPADSRLYGVAVDYGTTSIAAYLIDLEDGRILSKSGIMNPQIAYGEDVVTRISYTIQNKDGRHILQNALAEATNNILETFCLEHTIRREQIVDMVAVGNTAIHHFLHGLPIRQLGLAPYIPAVSSPLDSDARYLGINIAPGARIHTPGIIAGYVGADHVSMLLASGIFDMDETVLAVDIGTNTEMTLRRGDRFLCCSCASGPAFEGAHLTDGMRAAPGAIEKVQIDDSVHIQTIDGQKPIGICGSGIMDVVAEMRRNDIINKRGRFNEDSPFITGEKKDARCILSPAANNGHGRDITISKKDINEIMLAKAAIRTGINILMERTGTEPDDIDRILIAGAFGTYIDIESAVRIKMLPDLPLDRFRQIGNAAGMGANEMLLDKKKRIEAADIAMRVEYTELTTKKDFNSIFAKAMLM